MSNLDYAELMKPVISFLGCETPKAWLDEAVQNLDILMQDHANCEKKAASTAMNLMFRYSFFSDLQIKLAQLVREEMLHYEQVLELMAKRGQEWTAISAGRYAGGLRKEVRTFEPEALIDILVVGDVATTSKLKNPKEDIQMRIERIREVEKDLILSPDENFRFHSGVPIKAA